MTTKAQQHLTGMAAARHSGPCRPLDAACPGLRLVALTPPQVQQRKRWIYRFRGLRALKLGEYPVMSLADARKAWRQQKNSGDDWGQGDPRLHLEQLNAHAAAKTGCEKRFRDGGLRGHDRAEPVEVRRASAAESRRLREREVIPRLGEGRFADLHLPRR